LSMSLPYRYIPIYQHWFKKLLASPSFKSPSFKLSVPNLKNSSWMKHSGFNFK
jgi:hypothetical protein